MKVRILPRTLRFKQPAGTSRGVYLTRRVWYVAVSYRRGGRTAFGLGECAPLHDLSCDFDANYEQNLARLCRELELSGSLDDDALRPFPSIRFGLETALRSAEASLRGDYLTLYDTPFTRGEAGIPTNGLVWMGTKDEMLARMEAKLATGSTCIKLKIGAINWPSELEMIRTLRQRFSKECVEIRVDANGGFGINVAQRRLEELAKYDIHSIEQPIRQGHWREMAELCRNTPLPIALDEELIGVNEPEAKRSLLDEIRPQFIVLKPSLHGGLSGAEEWMAEARRRGTGYWVTSALESNVGLNALAQWVSALPPAPDGCPRHQGLGTGMLFEENFTPASLSMEGETLWRYPAKEREFLDEVRKLEAAWRADTPTLPARTSGSTGKPKEVHLAKDKMRLSAEATRDALVLRCGDTALLCMPVRYIAGKMQVVRALTLGMQLVCVAPSSHPLRSLRRAPDFAAMTPMQVWETLQSPRERRLLRNIRVLIIGGGSVSAELQAALAGFPNAIYSTYGMTETLTHIALRRLNGAEADTYYRPLPGVRVWTDADGCLCIDTPVCDGEVVTNDRAEVLADNHFRILGRRDNVVCSGGIKLQIEELEQKLSLPTAFALTSVPDPKLGEALTLLYCGATDSAHLLSLCREQLGRYEVPRHAFAVESLPQTETGKPARAQARELAAKMLAAQGH